MSASEKLKALEAEIDYFDVYHRLKVLNALPQIVAVVEAAEACVRNDGRNDSGLTRLSASNARIALSALEEALS